MPAPPPQPFPPQGGFPSQGAPPPAMGGGYQQAPAPDPYASMRPPPGRQFDLRPVDDGVPVETVRSGGFRAALVIGIIMAVAGGVLGVGFGMAMSGRRAFNDTNRAAKKVKSEVEEMHKSVTQIGAAVAMSQQRAQAAKLDRLAFDPKLIEDLEKVKVDPRPDTSAIFRVDYFRMSDLAVDNLMSYYYDTIALYGEVERFVKKSKADKDSLAAFAAKQSREGRHQIRHRVRRRRQGGRGQPGRDAQPRLQGRRHRLLDGSAGGLRDPGELRRQLEHPAGGPQARRQAHGPAGTDAAAGIGHGRLARSGAHGAVPHPLRQHPVAAHPPGPGPEATQ